VEEILHEYLALTLPLSRPRKERINMRNFYKKHYDESSVPLLQFYEDYYRNHYKDHLEKKREYQRGQKTSDYDINNPFGLGEIERIEDARTQLRNHIAVQWKENLDAEVIDIDLQDLEHVTGNLPSFSDEVPLSVSVFAQPFLQKGTTGLIVPEGKYLAGYGKYFSRFLYLFDEEVTDHLRKTNLDLTDHHVAEICGDAHFNANLHPPLLPREISYPTGESGQADIQLRSSNLEVELDPQNEHDIWLRHGPSGKRVFPVDLGFLNPQTRPPLYQLLTRFTPVASFKLFLPERPQSLESKEPSPTNERAEEDGEEESTIIRRPRIRLEKRIVLARQQWQVPSQLFPERGGQESDVEYYIRVNRWRCKHNIPEEVYVCLRPLSPTDDKKEESSRQTEGTLAEQLHGSPPNADTSSEKDQENEVKSKKKEEVSGSQEEHGQNQTEHSRDYRKPQYIDFSNPLLVNLFGKITINIDHYVATIKERFPDSDELPKGKDERYADEIVLQIDAS
jgi:hypothetical protein